MNISNSIKALLSLSGKRQLDLLGILDIASRQSLSNKFSGDRWSASDLVKIAEYTGSKLAFILPDGERVVIAADDPCEGAGGVLLDSPNSGVTESHNRRGQKAVPGHTE